MRLLWVVEGEVGRRVPRVNGGDAMAETGKGTARPWSRGNRGAMFMAPSHERWVVRGPEGEYVARINNPVRSTEESDANAELIVRAVNAHDSLVAALKEIARGTSRVWPSQQASGNELMVFAAEALALAEPSPTEEKGK
jgi:hypothetical protein